MKCLSSVIASYEAISAGACVLNLLLCCLTYFVSSWPERPITFCLDTKSNKKIKPAQSLPLPTRPAPGRVRWQALAFNLQGFALAL